MKDLDLKNLHFLPIFQTLSFNHNTPVLSIDTGESGSPPSMPATVHLNTGPA
ncbi:hypothetical protein J2Z22_004820 [Paenibacillus forsythiae]|uniref:Uncharacterized protein n=1 Tax=Paenibacillus forsythiae TaxID=365616 RepID=A0ABU3HEI7_9BACL|nr:hypothetical protein [Paenibacillus forsythiae]